MLRRSLTEIRAITPATVNSTFTTTGAGDYNAKTYCKELCIYQQNCHTCLAATLTDVIQ